MSRLVAVVLCSTGNVFRARPQKQLSSRIIKRIEVGSNLANPTTAFINQD